MEVLEMYALETIQCIMFMRTANNSNTCGSNETSKLQTNENNKN